MPAAEWKAETGKKGRPHPRRGCAARRLSVHRPRGRNHLRGAEGAQIFPRRHNCSVALRGLRVSPLSTTATHTQRRWGLARWTKSLPRQLVKLSTDHATLRHGARYHASGPPEHSIEVELPWLQKVLGDFELCPSLWETRATRAAARWAWPWPSSSRTKLAGSTLMLASSDLSHYHTYDEAVTIDHKTLNALAVWDYFSMSRNFDARVWEACGGAPIVAAMISAERMGATRTDRTSHPWRAPCA